jgi:uncharacterized coiled-coil protein SlyX
MEQFHINTAERMLKAGMSDTDKRVFQTYIEELSGNIGKNRTNIQLIAKELQSVTDRVAEVELKNQEVSS